MTRRGLTPQEWEQKEREYETAIQEINITPSITQQDIKELIAKLDKVYSTAYFDFSRTKTAYERVQRQNRTLAKSLFLSAKSGQIEALGSRPSDEVCKAYAETKMTEAPENALSPLDLENHTAARFSFMQAVIEILNAKRQMLITDQAVLKLEASLQ